MTTNNSGTLPEGIRTAGRQADAGIHEELRKVLRLIHGGGGLLSLAAPLAWFSGKNDALVTVGIAMALVAAGLVLLRVSASRIRWLKLSLLTPVGEQRLRAFLTDDAEGTGEPVGGAE